MTMMTRRKRRGSMTKRWGLLLWCVWLATRSKLSDFAKNSFRESVSAMNWLRYTCCITRRSLASRCKSSLMTRSISTQLQFWRIRSILSIRTMAKTSSSIFHSWSLTTHCQSILTSRVKAASRRWWPTWESKSFEAFYTIRSCTSSCWRLPWWLISCCLTARWRAWKS